MFRTLATSVAITFAAGSAFATECIAPANPGGGWDFTCRQIGKLLYDLDLVDEPVVITKLAGAGGGLAFSTVVNERNDDPDLIIAASSATTTRLAQNAFGGATADQVRWVGTIGADPGVIVVAADSEYETLSEMVDAILADPSSVAFPGGSAVGGFDHLKPGFTYLFDNQFRQSIADLLQFMALTCPCLPRLKPVFTVTTAHTPTTPSQDHNLDIRSVG